MALTKVINDLADLNQSGTTNALKGCAGDTSEQPASSSSIEYLIVAGGAGGGWSGGGGGAGGLLTDTTTVYHGTPTVLTIGEGGDGILTTVPTYLGNGNDSGFNGIRTIGGGTGGSYYIGTGWQDDGKDGGSGGGGASTGYATTGGNGTTDQGMSGGIGFNASAGWGGGGGGGAGTTVGAADGEGDDGTANPAGNGGSGRDMQSFISSTNANLAQIGDVSGSNVWFAGGGGGGIQDQSPVSVSAGTGGVGGGADGSNSDVKPTAAQSNTGGGGGGGGQQKTGGTWYEGDGGDGGSGVVVLKYDNTIVTGYTLNSEDTYTVNWPADKYGVAYWPLTLDVKDVGGNYDGTATDITYTNGQFNQAASFNGSSSYITLPNSVEVYKGTGKFAISAWFKTDTIPGTEQMLYCTFETAYLFIKLKASGVIEGQVAEATTGTGRVCETPTGTISAGIWYHVVFTGDTNDLRLYIDGTLSDSESTWNGTFYTSSSGCSIGSRNVGTNLFWDGEIEQVRIYSGPLTTSEVQDIYNNSKPGSLPPLKTSSDLTTTICNFPSGVTGTALYQFEGTANDSCTVGPYNGTFTSPAYGTGKFGPECASFNGSSSYIDTNYTLPAISTISFSLWFKTSTTGSQMYMFGDFDSFGANASGRFALSIESTNYFGIRTGDGSSYFTDNTTALATSYQNGMWHHAVLTANGTALKLYIDGSLIASITSSVAVGTAGAQSMIFGRLGHYSTSYFNGDMDQVRIFQIELSSQQVYDLWNKENDIQTYFPDAPTSGTDTLVFKEGSGEITFKNDSPPGAEVGMLRYNSTLGQMEHFNSGGWKDFTNCTTSVCNYPITGTALYQFNNNLENTCGTPTGTGTDITYSVGQFKNAAVFNGSTSRIELGNQTWFNSGDYSVSLWLMLEGNDSDYQEFVSQRTTGDAGSPINLSLYGVSYSSNPGKFYFSIGNGGGTTNFVSNTAISKSIWYHLVFTVVAGGTMNIYIDGVVDSNSATESGTRTAPTTQNLAIGANGLNSGTTYPFNGKIDQFRVFNSALSATQVTQLYNEAYCP